MNTQFKFTTLENSAKYVIDIDVQFLKSKTRHFIFRTESQLKDFFMIAAEKNMIENIKDNGKALILLTCKNREFALVVNVFSNPEKKTTTIIKIKYLLSKGHAYFNKIYGACPSENIIDMTNYIIPTRIVVRDFVDIHQDTIFIKKQKIDAYISYFVYTSKKYFLKKYDINNVFHKIAGGIFQESCITIKLEDILDKEPFWIWLEEETLHNEDNYYTSKNNFLCCLSLIKKVKHKKVFYDLLLDQVYKNPGKQKIEEIKKYKEVFFEEPILIQQKEIKIRTSRKANRRGLKIIKKGNGCA